LQPPPLQQAGFSAETCFAATASQSQPAQVQLAPQSQSGPVQQSQTSQGHSGPQQQAAPAVVATAPQSQLVQLQSPQSQPGSVQHSHTSQGQSTPQQQASAFAVSWPVLLAVDCIATTAAIAMASGAAHSKDFFISIAPERYRYSSVKQCDWVA